MTHTLAQHVSGLSVLQTADLIPSDYDLILVQRRREERARMSVNSSWFNTTGQFLGSSQRRNPPDYPKELLLNYVKIHKKLFVLSLNTSKVVVFCFLFFKYSQFLTVAFVPSCFGRLRNGCCLPPLTAIKQSVFIKLVARVCFHSNLR